MDSSLTFEVHRPVTVNETLELLSRRPGARLLAGGTDLVPNLRRGLEQPPSLVSLDRVAQLDHLTIDGAGLRLGAALSLARIAAEPHVAHGYRALAEAAAAVAGPGHRSVATLGGNLCQDTRCVFYNQSAWWRAANQFCLKRSGQLCHVAPQGTRCHAAFCSDTAAALLVLGAQAEIVSSRGVRRLPLAQLYRDDGAAHLTLAPDELLHTLHLPQREPGSVSGYRKGRVRGAMDFALAGVAMSLVMHGAALAHIKVALTGTDSQPLLLQGCEVLLGGAVDAESLSALGKLVARQVSPARTTVTPSNHRRQVAVALAQRLLRELADEAGGAAS